MADERAKRDVNRITSVLGVTDDASQDLTQVRIDPTTKALLTTASSAFMYVWDTATLAWVKMQQPTLEADSVTAVIAQTLTVSVSNTPSIQSIINTVSMSVVNTPSIVVSNTVNINTISNTVNVSVQTSVLPDGAATSANQTTMITALQLIDDIRAALQSVATDEIRTFPSWTSYGERKNIASATAGDNTITFTCPSGKKWEVSLIVFFNAISSISAGTVYTNQTGNPDVFRIGTVVANDGQEVNARFFVEAGSIITIQFSGCTAGDTLYASLFAKEWTL